MDRKTMAAMIDHTLLKPEATPERIRRVCDEGNRYQFASVCVNGANVRLAASLSRIPVACVVGFPLGAMHSSVKAAEARQAIADGASEIDRVINIGAARAGEWDLVESDIRQVVEASAGRVVKAIIETALLSDAEKRLACEAAVRAGAQFVKTSTGFSSGGASVADVKLMRAVVGPDIGVKASGGIRDLATAQAMLEAGATRLGASAGVAIVESLQE